MIPEKTPKIARKSRENEPPETDRAAIKKMREVEKHRISRAYNHCNAQRIREENNSYLSIRIRGRIDQTMFKPKTSQVLLLVLFSSIFLETLLNFSLLGSVFDVVHQVAFFRGVILNFFWWNLANVFLVVIAACVRFIEKERSMWRTKSISSIET
jgi:hypothetical protein